MAVRYSSRTELHAQVAQLSFRIKQASVYDQGPTQVWVVELSVGRDEREVDGWVFIEPEFMELRFDQHDTMEPPGFLSGRYLRQTTETSSLGLLFDAPTDENLITMEDAIKRFIDGCLFCVRSVTDTATGDQHTSATVYRHNRTTIPIRRKG